MRSDLLNTGCILHPSRSLSLYAEAPIFLRILNGPTHLSESFLEPSAALGRLMCVNSSHTFCPTM